MARTLPWLKNQPIVKATTPSDSRSAKRQRRLNAADTSDGTVPEASPTTRRSSDDAPRLRRPIPSPSTSPPPQPPEKEFMREGLDADDVYIMVEDEFYATAKLFTQHLHHAEYVRLKNLAKIRQSAPARPVDAKTTVRPDTKIGKVKRTVQAKQKNNLAPIIGGIANLKEGDSTRRPDGNEELEASDSSEEFTGGTLGGLMTRSATDDRSLTGLQGVRLNSRAAAGYSHSHKIDAKTRAKPPLTGSENATTGTKGFDQLQVSDEDLDSMPRATVTEKQSVPLARDLPAKPDDTPQNKHVYTSAHRAVLDPIGTAIKAPGGKNVVKRTVLHSLIDFKDGSFRPTPLQRNKKRREKEKKDMSEIPMFLV